MTYRIDGGFYSRAADGGADAQLLAGRSDLPGAGGVPRSWSPDGQRLAFTSEGDIWILPVARDPSPFTRTPYDERMPHFSPDGRWLAYVSDESGRNEVYVQPYPGPKGRRMVSTDGGLDPAWSPDGREIFYRDLGGRQMMVVTFASEPAVRVGKPRLLFDGEYSQHTQSRQYDIAPDGQRFLMIERPQARSINVVVNWFDELNRLVPKDEP